MQKNTLKYLLRYSIALVIAVTAFNLPLFAQNVFPGISWKSAVPEKYGYDAQKLSEIRQTIINDMKTTGLVVVVNGEIIFKFGNIEQVSYIASCRKSILAMLYGNYVADGTIDLSRTLESLNFDDVGGLLPIEKKATIYDLITARSGVYHPASNGGDDTKYAPKRGTKNPGEYYLYNNWDFNAAGAAFERMTGRNIFEAFKTDLAEPIQLQDFDHKIHVKGGNMEVSRYPSYHFHLSTRDMARIGYLMLREGMWGNKRLIPSEWYNNMITAVTPIEEMNPEFRKSDEFGYGFMWWIYDNKSESSPFKGAYTAKGAMGQYITILPALDMVIVHKTDAIYGRSTTWSDYSKLIDLLIEAKNSN